MRVLGLIIAAILVSAVSIFAARHFTMAQLTNTGSLYDSFETTPSGWLFSDKIGSPAASRLERAKVAIAGPLGLSSKEAVYFVAVSDTERQPLRASCDYRVSGPPMDTRWWSLTLYDTQTQHYVPNSINRSSWNSAVIPRDEDGGWSLIISSTPKPGTWLPSQQNPEATFELNLRVYNPSAAARAVLPNIPLPAVERLSC